jgi:hypothetical protein
MRYDQATDSYVPVPWEAAFALIARELGALADPNEAEFYPRGWQRRIGAIKRSSRL